MSDPIAEDIAREVWRGFTRASYSLKAWARSDAVTSAAGRLMVIVVP
jgi:hypothetical protein